jgi:hypothetical protein
MIPLVGHVAELRHQKAVIDRVAKQVMDEKGVKIDYLVGTMIEVPRAALTADEIAAGSRVLQLRHERPHADDDGLLARRRRKNFLQTTWTSASTRSAPSRNSIKRASASS